MRQKEGSSDAVATALELEAARGWGLDCMSAALLSGLLQGWWEMARPILTTAEDFASASAIQRWAYALLAVVKSAGFLAGLCGLYRIGTGRGRFLRVVMALATLGAIFFAAVWVVVSASGRFSLLYVFGGLWYQMVAPVALGVAALRSGGIPRWVAVWAIVVGLANSQIFRLLSPGPALLAQGALWLLLGYGIYSSAPVRRGGKLPVRSPSDS